MNKLVLWLKAKSHQLLASQAARKVFHTFWQAAGGALVAGVVTVHSTQDVKAVVMVAVAAGLAAIKALVLAQLEAKASQVASQ